MAKRIPVGLQLLAVLENWLSSCIRPPYVIGNALGYGNKKLIRRWDSTRPVQFFCKSLPFYLHNVLWLKIRRSNNIGLQTLSGVNCHEFLALCSKYDIDVSCLSENIIKKAVWNVFAQIVDIWI